MGNRLQKTDSSTSTTNSVFDAANRLTSTTGAGASTYANDADGNTLTGGGRTNTWDSQNRLVENQAIPPEYLTSNALLQQLMLVLVEQCHQSEYQATLNCCIQKLNEKHGKWHWSAHSTEAIASVMTVVLSTCYDVNKEKTLSGMSKAFAKLNSTLSPT